MFVVVGFLGGLPPEKQTRQGSRALQLVDIGSSQLSESHGRFYEAYFHSNKWGGRETDKEKGKGREETEKEEQSTRENDREIERERENKKSKRERLKGKTRREEKARRTWRSIIRDCRQRAHLLLLLPWFLVVFRFSTFNSRKGK